MVASILRRFRTIRVSLGERVHLVRRKRRDGFGVESVERLLEARPLVFNDLPAHPRLEDSLGKDFEIVGKLRGVICFGGSMTISSWMTTSVARRATHQPLWSDSFHGVAGAAYATITPSGYRSCRSQSQGSREAGPTSGRPVPLHAWHPKPSGSPGSSGRSVLLARHRTRVSPARPRL